MTCFLSGGIGATWVTQINDIQTKVNTLTGYVQAIQKNQWNTKKNDIYTRYCLINWLAKYLLSMATSNRNWEEWNVEKTKAWSMWASTYYPNEGAVNTGYKLRVEYDEKVTKNTNYEITLNTDHFYCEWSLMEQEDTKGWGISFDLGNGEYINTSDSYGCKVYFTYYEPALCMLRYISGLMNFWDGKKEGCNTAKMAVSASGLDGAKLAELFGWPSVGKTECDNFASKWLPSLFGRWTSNLRFPNNV